MRLSLMRRINNTLRALNGEVVSNSEEENPDDFLHLTSDQLQEKNELSFAGTQIDSKLS